MGPRSGCGQLISYNFRGLGHYAHDCMNLMRTSCLYYTQFDHEMEEYPTMIARLCDKGVL